MPHGSILHLDIIDIDAERRAIDILRRLEMASLAAVAVGALVLAGLLLATAIPLVTNL